MNGGEVAAPALRHRLSYRLAMLAVLTAFVLGLCLSLTQIGIDLSNERSKIDDTVLEVMRTVEDPAAQAVYTLDRKLADRVLTGLFQFGAVHQAALRDDFGDTLATQQRPRANGRLRWLAGLTFGDEKRYAIELMVENLTAPVGKLTVEIDPYLIAQPFFERAGVLILSGVVRNVLLAAILVTLFYFMLTRPLATVAQSLATIGNAVKRPQDVTIPSHHEHDELGLIVERFNTVLEERDRAHAELHRHREHLEDLVAERTAEVNKAQNELLRNERLVALGQLVGIVSHELRNPLGTLRNSAEIVKRFADENPSLERSATIIERNVARCDALVGDLLDFVRDTAIERELTPIGPWLQEVVNEFDFPSSVRVRYTVSTELELAIDAERLRRALINVLDNACDAIAQDTPHGREASGDITISSGESKGRAEIVIEDSGPGVPEDTRDDIFEPLFSTKSFGVGLGLTIVRQIMERHDGGVDIRSDASRGTAVTLWLPLA